MLKLYSALISLSLIWGLSFVFIKWLLEPAGVWGTVFLRCLAGALILLPILWSKRKQLEKPLPWKSLVIVGIFNAGLPWGLISLSETQINSNTASILNATTPIWTGLIGLVLFSSVLNRWQWIGIALGFSGIWVLMDFKIEQLIGEDFIGVGTMILAAISYGYASQYTRRYLSNTSVLVITTCSLLVGAVIGLLGMISTEPLKLSIFTDPLAMLAVIGLGCFGSGIAHLLYYYMMAKSSPEFATTVTYFIPATAMIWGYILLDETITSNLMMGLLIIFIGVYLSTRKTQKQYARVEASQ